MGSPRVMKVGQIGSFVRSEIALAISETAIAKAIGLQL